MKGGDIMAKHIVYIFYYLCITYFIFIEFSYLYFKIKKDKRFKDIGFFKYLNSPLQILKGEK